MVEFAVCAPLLALLSLGVLDLGRVYRLENQLRNAARAGAIFGETAPYNQTPTAGTPCADPFNIRYQVWSEAGNSNFSVDVAPSESAVTGCPTVLTASPVINAGCPLRVTAGQRFVPVTPLLSALIGTPTVHGSVTVRTQGGGASGSCPSI